MRFYSLEHAKSLGWIPIEGLSVDTLRSYGVPIYARGALPIRGTSAVYFQPAWAADLMRDWPLRANFADEDFGHELLKTIIGRVVRTGDKDLALAACSIAMLEGASAVASFLHGPNYDGT